MGERALDRDLHQRQGGEAVSLEQSMNTLAAAINRLVEAIGGGQAASDVLPSTSATSAAPGAPAEMVIINMDDAGVPSKFKLRCSICGELGRNSRTCQPTPDGSGSYHWKVTEE